MAYPDYGRSFAEESPPFKDDGFITGAIVLPGLEMPLSLTPKQYFKFDGVVPDMWRYLKSLSADMRYFTDKYIGDPRYATGFNSGLIWNDYVGMFMAVKNVSPRVNLSNIAHEAAEVAFRFGYISELETYLQNFGLKKTIAGEDSHIAGSVAGILIPRSKGVDVVSLYEVQDPHTYRKLISEGFIDKK